MKFFEQIFNKKNLEQSKGEIQEKAKQEKQENIEKKEIFINNGYFLLQDGKSIELINLEKNSEPEVLQRAYNQLLENNTFEDVEKVIELADKKNLELVPDSKSLQLAFERAIYGMFGYNGFENLKKIENFAKERGMNIEFKITQDKLQDIYDNANEISEMQKIEEFAKERGMNIEFGKATQARFQEIYDNANEISKMQEIEEFAKERDMNIEFGKATQDRIREIFDSANNISEIQEIEEFAKERGIKLGKTTQDRIREIFDSANNISEIQEIEEFAKERGIKLGKTTQDKLQEIYCYNAQWDKTDKLKEIEEFAKERGIKLEIQDSFQKIFDAEASDKTQGGLAAYHISRNLKAAEKLGIKIEIKKEIIQQAFENLCVAFGEDSLDAENIEEVQQIAQSNGIELENVKELIERAYIGMVHNTEMGHVDSRRDKFLEMLQEIGSNLTYKDVAKMDYLKYLEVPKNEILDIEKTITINDSSINVVFHGKKGVKFFDDMEVRVSVGMKGKFIMGTTKDDNLKFVFDSTLGEHADIATKYDLKALGGGWLQIDEQNKRIVIFGESQKFGVEPRSISRQIVADVFPEYKLSVE